VLRYFTLTLLVISFTGCAGMQFHVCGIDMQEMSNAEPEDYGKLALGAASSFATHVAGHYLAAEVFDVDIHQDGFDEVIDYSNNPSDSNVRWMARGGFILQLAVNTALVELAGDSYFTKGYTALTSVELATYGLRHKDDGDFNLLDEAGGNGSLEYGLYGAWAAYNFYRVSVSKKE
jgi:hypothetical protein